MSQNDKFQVHIETEEDRNVVYFIGELDLSMAPELQSSVDPYIGQERLLVLNLKQLAYIDSTGIGFIISMLKARDEQKAPFAVEEIPGQIQKLFDITGITPFLNVKE